MAALPATASLCMLLHARHELEAKTLKKWYTPSWASRSPTSVSHTAQHTGLRGPSSPLPLLPPLGPGPPCCRAWVWLPSAADGAAPLASCPSGACSASCCGDAGGCTLPPAADGCCSAACPGWPPCCPCPCRCCCCASCTCCCCCSAALCCRPAPPCCFPWRLPRLGGGVGSVTTSPVFTLQPGAGRVTAALKTLCPQST